jgi:hypothetical protein
MFGDVVLCVLHHDQVAGKVTVGREPTLKDNRDPRLEQLGRVAMVDHRNGHVVVGDYERDVLAGLVYAWLDGALDAKTVAAELGSLGHRFVGSLEVDGGIAEALKDEEPESHRDDREGDELTAPASE